jgi:mono/diheme cytochrome c family protein
MWRGLLLISLLMTTACGAALDEAQVDAIVELEGDPEAGEQFFEDNCERCHGPDGNGDGRGPSLEGNSFSRREIVENILRGPFGMPSFADESDRDLAGVTSYVESL